MDTWLRRSDWSSDIIAAFYVRMIFFDTVTIVRTVLFVVHFVRYSCVENEEYNRMNTEKKRVLLYIFQNELGMNCGGIKAIYIYIYLVLKRITTHNFKYFLMSKRPK